MHEYESTGVLASFDVLYPLRYNPKKKEEEKLEKIFFSRIMLKRLFVIHRVRVFPSSDRIELASKLSKSRLFFHASTIDAWRLSRVLCSYNNLAGHALRCLEASATAFFFLFSSFLLFTPDITSTLWCNATIVSLFFIHTSVLNRSLTEISFQMHPYSRSWGQGYTSAHVADKCIPGRRICGNIWRWAVGWLRLRHTSPASIALTDRGSRHRSSSTCSRCTTSSRRLIRWTLFFRSSTRDDGVSFSGHQFYESSRWNWFLSEEQ